MISHNGHIVTQNGTTHNGAVVDAPSKPTRNSDHRHSQSIGRQRAAQADVTPLYRAQAAANIIRKAMAEDQPIDMSAHQLDDAAWSELVAMLSPEELAAVNAAGEQSEQADDEPVSTALAPEPERAGWRDVEPLFVHSLKWRDQDGIEHLHVVRSDDMDDVLRQVRTVKAFIAAAKARDEKPAPRPEPEQADSAYDEPHAELEQAESACDEPTDPTRLWCERHQTWLYRRERNGQRWYSHKTSEGWCRRAAK